MVDITSGVNIGSGVWVGIDYSPASGGNVTTYSTGSNTFQVHTFSTSGTFVVRDTLASASLLVVGGGGGGGASSNGQFQAGGGGGAGGYVSITSNVTPDSYSITVGTGGVGGNDTTSPSNGTNSTALGYTALGGGSGGQLIDNGFTPDLPGGDGGSGGGAHGGQTYYTAGNTIQNSTLGYGQGNNGSLNVFPGVAGIYSGGTGGGAASTGGGADGSISNSINGTNTKYSAAGVGGTIQTSPSSSGSPSNTLPYFGSGGGGGAFNSTGRQTGTSGANGIVIISYEI